MNAEPVEPEPSPSGRRRAQRATSEELVTAAIRVIGREGVAAATTRKIAEEAGVPQGTVHYWFTDKNELLQDVVLTIVERLRKTVATGDRPAGVVTSEGLRTGLRAAWAEVTGDDPGTQLGYYELTALALRKPSMRELARRQYSSYRDLAAQTLAPLLEDVEPRRAAALAQLVAVTFDGLALAWLADPEGTQPEQVLDLLADAVLQARDGAPGAAAPAPDATA
ncbi:TetR/AcrR family transcriptional regulator [Streptomyces scabiei]|uniref:TetR/AcrR family transcriptional regulator n=1 Tax=Streptomyces scabiei TaxID=1930 RepID=UPI00298F998C|nr:TetR/AcrR family transcriptional regulator [Streptomyces scabiei]MDW8805362.1 TetR/AcrR family transcriptional regulator [Streptomyces scabiei]